uniref:Ig-like domain-containing protein n=1 Tax=Poecilia latipinna TaxID=48699 RepID=A0A3B3VHB2_9TELE
MNLVSPSLFFCLFLSFFPSFLPSHFLFFHLFPLSFCSGARPMSSTQSQGCPQRCDCIAKLKTVSCFGKRLSSLPEGIPPDTKKLELSDNMISVLEPNAFSSLQNLQSLSLRGNQLKLVPMGAFSRLSNLTSLDLSGNKIVILLDFTFQDLKSLKNLELHLVNTNLAVVQPYALGGLRQIRLLNLSTNSLVTLEEGAFQSVNTLETLRLDRNPLACDCRLLWILQRRKTLNFDGASPVCMTPVEVQGRALSAFTDSALFDHFTCQKPKIRNRKLQQISAREGQVVSFICRAEGEPTPVIFWISPQRRRITTKNMEGKC